MLPGGGLRVGLQGEVSAWPGFDEGRWWVQDASAAVPARLLDVQPGETALDLCAAPGGKTLQLAAAGAKVTAVDRSAPAASSGVSREPRPHRPGRRGGRRRRRGVGRRPRTFDAVLLDAPCSATGTFRRHPDVLLGGEPAESPRSWPPCRAAAGRRRRRVKPGGRLVYCVCSLEPEEGEAQVERLPRRPRGLRARSPIDPAEGGAPAGACRDDGRLRILPHDWAKKGGTDGFFVARLDRVA